MPVVKNISQINSPDYRKIRVKVISKFKHIAWKFYRFLRYLAGKAYHLAKKAYHLAGKAYRQAGKTYRHIKSHITIKNYDVISIKAWCEKNDHSYQVIETNQTVAIDPPHIISTNCDSYKLTQVQGKLPEVYLAKLKNVIVVENTDIVIKRRTAFYDEMALDIEDKYGERNNYAGLIYCRQRNPHKVRLKFTRNRKTKLPHTAIHFCKDYSFNYFHWLIEGLPRLSIIEKFPELDSVPLLIDSDLKPQQLEALRILTKGKRELISLEFNQAYRVKNLYYPSGLSHVHNNYCHPVDYANDIVVSPDAIRYLRKNFLPLAKNPELKNKYYISRRKVGASRRLLNDDEVESFLTHQGFTIIYPEELSFMEQIQLFSQAKIVMGASGSAFANMIFSPPGCQIYVLSANNDQVNFNVFSTLANVSQLEFNFVLGKDEIIEPFTQTHNAFKVSIPLIESILQRKSDSPTNSQNTHNHSTKRTTSSVNCVDTIL